MMNNVSVVPRPAATLILLRDSAGGVEVLMVRRAQLAEFAGGAYVFPGGALDHEDQDEVLARLCSGLDDASASARLGMPQGGLGYWTAAVRESYEEVGVLMAYDTAGRLVTIGEHNESHYDAARRAIAAGTVPLQEFVRAENLTLAADQLHYFSHWITQAGRPRRYDTRFFIARAPAEQRPSHDGSELVDHLWIAPAEALARNRRGEFNLLSPL